MISTDNITIIIVVSDRLLLFKKCIDSLLHSLDFAGIKKFKIHIVLNAAERVTEEYVKGLTGGSFKIFEAKKKLFPGAARNLGLKDISSEWIYFIDDDAYVNEEFFKTATDFLKIQDYSFIGGPNISPLKSEWFSDLTQVALENPIICLGISKRYSQDREVEEKASESSIILCNFFLRRDCLTLFENDQIFDSSLWGGEEICLVQNLLSFGKTGLYVSKLFVWHERRKTLIGFCKQMFKYGLGRGQMFNRLNRFKPYHVAPLIFPLLITVYLMEYFSYFISIYVFYCLLALVYQQVKGHRWIYSLLIFVFPLIHLFYSAGVLVGLLFRVKLYLDKTFNLLR